MVEASKNLANKTQLETSLDLEDKIEKKIKELKALYLSYFIGKNYFDNDGSQNHLIFQLVFIFFKFLVALSIKFLDRNIKDYQKKV